jgi:hypothetical protein
MGTIMRGFQGGFGITMISLAIGATILYQCAPPCTNIETAGLASMVMIALAVGFHDLRRAVSNVAIA